MRTRFCSLHDDGNYNIGTVPLVLFEGRRHRHPRPGLSYPPTELQRIFARYNGTGADADHYGVEVYGVYQIFERYNAMAR